MLLCALQVPACPCSLPVVSLGSHVPFGLFLSLSENVLIAKGCVWPPRTTGVPDCPCKACTCWKEKHLIPSLCSLSWCNQRERIQTSASQAFVSVQSTGSCLECRLGYSGSGGTCSLVFLTYFLVLLVSGRQGSGAAVPKPFAPGTRFHGRQFFHGLWQEVRDGLGMIQAHYIYRTLYFYYYIGSTSDHQASESRSWGPLI